MKSNRILFVLGSGFEELELVAPLDVLRRAEQHCVVASCETTPLVTGRNDITLQADCLLNDAQEQTFDGVVIPGGPGVGALKRDQRVLALLRRHRQHRRLVAAICAGPLVLMAAGILPGPRCTGHASIANELEIAEDADVVLDDGVLTSRGAGTALDFGLALVEELVGAEVAQTIASSVHRR